MRLIGKSVILAATAAGFCIAVAAGTASALPVDYTVSPAGDTAIAANSGTNTLIFQDDTHTAAKLTCAPVGSTPAFKGTGTAHGGGHTFVPATPVPPYTGYDAAADLGSATLGSTAAPCKNAVVGNVTVTLGTFPWHLGCSAKTASGCTGYLYGVSAHLVATGCTIDATGWINGSYNNSGSFTGTTAPGLTISGVTGSLCSLIPVANGDHAHLSGVIGISPAITIS
jgi:hypothetical protein